jgi:hypothetical protein
VAEEGRVEESINKMLLQNRIDKFRNGSGGFMKEADKLAHQLKTIGSVMNQGARSEEEMSLYEEMMRVLNARIAKKN